MACDSQINSLNAKKRSRSTASDSRRLHSLPTALPTNNPSARSTRSSSLRPSRQIMLQQQEAAMNKGLTKPLEESNVGLKLMHLLGYREGQGLGKGGIGILEPIAAQRPHGREGVGVRQEREEKQRRLQDLEEVRQLYLARRTKNFKESASNKYMERSRQAHLKQAQKTVEELDIRGGRPASVLWWSESQKREESELPLVVPREDLEVSQPDEEPKISEQDEQAQLWMALTTAERLTLLLSYMRELDFYCMWCGAQYGSAEELRTECPGQEEEDH